MNSLINVVIDNENNDCDLLPLNHKIGVHCFGQRGSIVKLQYSTIEVHLF